MDAAVLSLRGPHGTRSWMCVERDEGVFDVTAGTDISVTISTLNDDCRAIQWLSAVICNTRTGGEVIHDDTCSCCMETETRVAALAAVEFIKMVLSLTAVVYLFLSNYHMQGTRCIWDAYCAILSPMDEEDASIPDPHNLVATVCVHLFKMVVDPGSAVALHRELLVYVHGFCRDMVTRAYLTGSSLVVIPADIHYLCLYSDYLAGATGTNTHLAQTMCHQWTWTRDVAYNIPDTTLDTVILAAWCARVYCQSCMCLYAVNDSLDASAIAQSLIGGRQRISIQLPRINDGIF